MKRFGALAALVVMTALGACTQGPDKAPLELEIGQVLRDQIRLRTTPPPQPPTLTRALLDTIEEPHIEVIIEEADLRDYLTLALARQDDVPGDVELWRTVDNITFGFRDGMLISTRGLRGTMLSAEVPADGQGPKGPAHGGQRSYSFQGDDSASFEIHMACDLKDLGPASLEIVEVTYNTRYMREHCVASDGGVVENEYWIDSQSGRLWQSRQWAGPNIGYIRIRQVVL